MGVSAAVDTIGGAVADTAATDAVASAATDAVAGGLTGGITDLTAGGAGVNLGSTLSGVGSIGSYTPLADVGSGVAAGVDAATLAGGSSLGSLFTPTNMLSAANLGSSLISANAAQNAANIQAQAAQGQQQLQAAIFNQQNAQLAPGRAAGYSALNQIGALGSGPYTQIGRAHV